MPQSDNMFCLAKERWDKEIHALERSSFLNSAIYEIYLSQISSEAARNIQMVNNELKSINAMEYIINRIMEDTESRPPRDIKKLSEILNDDELLI